MTVNEVLSLFGELKPHPFAESVLLFWLGELEGQLYGELFSRYAPTPVAPPERLGPSDADRVLLAAPPYDGIYLDWLTLKADAALGDTARANNDAALFNRTLTALGNAVNRERTFLGAGGVRFTQGRDRP